MLTNFRMLLGLTVLIAIIGMASYCFLRGGEPDKAKLDPALKSKYVAVTGTITDIDDDEDHAVLVKYLVKGQLYEQSRVWDVNPKNLTIGDNIAVKYAVDDPESIKTELEEGF